MDKYWQHSLVSLDVFWAVSCSVSMQTLNMYLNLMMATLGQNMYSSEEKLWTVSV
jgi:hypothetical protein